MAPASVHKRATSRQQTPKVVYNEENPESRETYILYVGGSAGPAPSGRMADSSRKAEQGLEERHG